MSTPSRWLNAADWKLKFRGGSHVDGMDKRTLPTTTQSTYDGLIFISDLLMQACFGGAFQDCAEHFFHTNSNSGTKRGGQANTFKYQR